MIARITSFAATFAPSAPSTVMRSVRGRLCQSVCVASTCDTSVAPMPKASAPKAPCVEVWLSPHTISMPGCVEALLRSDDVHDALARVAEAEHGDARLLRVARQVLHHAAPLGVCDGVEAAAGVRRHIVIGRGEGAVRCAQLQAALAQHAKGVARSVMDQMAIDVEQRLAVGALEDAVTRPDLVEESSSARAHEPPSDILPLALWPDATGLSAHLFRRSPHAR